MAARKTLVVADTREQRPWTLGPSCVIARRATLRSGDYSVLGLEDRVAVERKSLADFVGTVLRQWDRFRRELDRLRTFDVALVVVEAELREVLDGDYRSHAPPLVVLDRAIEIQVEHGIPVHFVGDRAASQRFADAILARAGEVVNRTREERHGGNGGATG